MRRGGLHHTLSSVDSLTDQRDCTAGFGWLLTTGRGCCNHAGGAVLTFAQQQQQAAGSSSVSLELRPDTRYTHTRTPDRPGLLRAECLDAVGNGEWAGERMM
jgi:hypothetical protein